jgi:hypothetical protein
MEALGNEGEMTRDVHQNFDDGPVNQLFPEVSRGMEMDSSLMLWPDIAVQEEFDLNMFGDGHVPDLFGRNEDFSLPESNSAGARF